MLHSLKRPCISHRAGRTDTGKVLAKRERLKLGTGRLTRKKYFMIQTHSSFIVTI